MSWTGNMTHPIMGCLLAGEIIWGKTWKKKKKREQKEKRENLGERKNIYSFRNLWFLARYIFYLYLSLLIKKTPSHNYKIFSHVFIRTTSNSLDSKHFAYVTIQIV
jgi:hypothetical protein